jgi:hypothetical protein
MNSAARLNFTHVTRLVSQRGHHSALEDSLMTT